MGIFRPGSGDIEAWELRNVETIESAGDLPPVENGRHQLEDMTGYYFVGFVMSDYALELGTQTPILGSHGGLDGFIHTGTDTAIYGRDASLFMRNVYVHAPGGQIFDMKADQTTEVLVESSAFFDAANLGNIVDLGVFDGMRVPTFLSCNFGDFDAGLTFTGTTDKVFVFNSPVRDVTANGVTCFEFDADFSAGVVDFTGCYVKSVQSDTEVVRVDPNATISEIFQYVGNTHDTTITQSNVLTGAADEQAVGYRVESSFPISDSEALGNWTIDSETTTTITTQAASKTDESAYVKVEGAITSNVNRRFSIGAGNATYEALKDATPVLNASVTLGTGNDETVAVAWFCDGTLVPGTATRVPMDSDKGPGSGLDNTVTAIGVSPDAVTGETFDVRVANLGSDTDITVGELNANLTAML